MQQANKKPKFSKSSMVADIASSVRDCSESVTRLGKIHGKLLKSNEVIVDYLLEAEEEKKKKLNYKELAKSSNAKQIQQPQRSGTQNSTPEESGTKI